MFCDLSHASLHPGLIWYLNENLRFCSGSRGGLFTQTRAWCQGVMVSRCQGVEALGLYGSRVWGRGSWQRREIFPKELCDEIHPKMMLICRLTHTSSPSLHYQTNLIYYLSSPVASLYPKSKSSPSEPLRNRPLYHSFPTLPRLPIVRLTRRPLCRSRRLLSTSIWSRNPFERGIAGW